MATRLQKQKEISSQVMPLGVLLGSLLVLGFQYQGYQPESEVGYEFLRLFRSIDFELLQGDQLCLLFLSLHYLRITLGVYFVDFDESFVEALDRLKWPEWTMWVDGVLRSVLAVTLILSTGGLATGSYSSMMKLLGLQVGAMLGYDILYWKVYYTSKGDVQWRANWFILVGDITVLFMVISGYALHSRLPHILWLAGPPAA